MGLRFVVRMSLMVADEALGEALSIPVGAPVMKRVRTAFNKDMQVQEYTLSYYNGSNYTYVIYAGIAEKDNTKLRRRSV